MNNKKINKIVKRAKEYVKQGYNYTEAIKLANEDVLKAEREKYESKI